MAVSHEIKSQLAKLLATEDLIVEHRKVETAQFNVHTRVLTLPLWDKASNVVYDLLVGHEVGHALFTPDEDWSENTKIPKQYVNIVEDARIEKLMKRKYMGLAKTFFNGYRELSDEDFFCLKDEDVSKMSLADRANLFFKIGNYTDIPIQNGEEKEIIDAISDAETFADVLIVSELLYKYCKKEKEEHKVDDIAVPPQQSGGGNQPHREEKTDVVEEESEDGNVNQQDNTDSVSGGESIPDTTLDAEPEVRTVDNLEESLRELISKHGQDNIYVEIPQVNLETVIAKNEEVHKNINSYFAKQQEIFDKYNTERNNKLISVYADVDLEYRKFKSSAQKEVNYLVKEFECRKSADAYARASTARTGVLDTARLHTYKYNEDLFKKVTVIPDGKNHGLVFILDWSGSMSQVLLDTCKQLFNLIWFCKKVSIPFEVYAFTNEWNRAHYDHEKDEYVNADLQPHYERKEGLACVSEDFNLMNMLTSKVSSKELESQLINVWRLACYFANSYQSRYSIPDRLSLSGTPLNESLVCLHQILPKFQKENKLQKVQCIVLTDGEANHLPYHVEVQRKWEDDPYTGTRRMNPDQSFIRDRKLGTTYKIGYDYHNFTDAMIRNLKDKFPTTNFIGIRVLAPRDANNFIRLYQQYGDKDFDKLHSDWKKQKSFCIKNSGYDAYFGMSATALAQDTEFEVAEDATKSQIKSAFVKSLKTKKLNKKVLGEFISLVA